MKTIAEHLRERNQDPAKFSFKSDEPVREIIFVGPVETFPGQTGTHEIDREALIRQADEVIEDKTDAQNKYAVFYK